MAIQEFVDFMERRFAGQIAQHSSLEPSQGEFAQLPEELDPRLADVLRNDGIEQLYVHQVDAFGSIRSGKDTVLVSRTASGKTLSFLLPILHDYVQAESPFGVLLL